MRVAQAIRSRLVTSLILAALAAGLSFTLHRSDSGSTPALARASYDALHILSPERSATTATGGVVVVYLDLPSYKMQGRDPAQPWPRGLYAQLVDRLTALGARAVVMDVVFADAGTDTAGNAELTKAIQRSGRVILAAESNDKGGQSTAVDRERLRLKMLVPPHAPFARAAVAWGVASQRIDDDLTVRQFLAGFPQDSTREAVPSLAWAAARWLRAPAVAAGSLGQANRRWLRYYGPPLTLPHVSIGQVLDPAGTPAGFFRDQIVFVGARPTAGRFGERQDEFRNPFHSWGNKELFMPGVEVHATAFANLLQGAWLRRLEPRDESRWLALGALLFGGGLIWLRPLPATGVALGGAVATLAVSVVAFGRGVWFPWLEVIAAQVPIGLVGGVLFHSVDWYRTRRRLEAERRAAEAKIREQAALIDKAHDAIVLQSLAGVVSYLNPSAESLFGWNLAEFQAPETIAEWTSPAPAAVAEARRAALALGEWNGELQLRTRAGRVVAVASRWTLICTEDARPKALLLINTDITAQKELEAQFLRTQRMNTIGTLAGGMAHDLNNALAPILMGVQLLRRKAADEEAGRMLGLMETNTHRGADLVRQVLLFARGRGGEFERLDLAPLIRELEKLVRETFPKQIAVEAYVPSDLWAVRGNPTQLHQVLLNLCVNARDAMPAGGRLSFAADNVELSEADAARIPGAKPGCFVSLLVSDTGEGMTPEVRARLFEPFFTTKGEGRGTGIGLATVQRIVQTHEGTLRVESEPGQGTTFEVWLPRAEEAVEKAPAPAATGLPRGQGELILVADDEQAIRELVAAELTAWGYRVLTAVNGAEAAGLFHQHAREVRLLLTDSSMPALDGSGAIKAVRQLKPALPVILTSGEALPGDATPPGVSVLNKPFTLDELLHAVARGLGTARGPD